MALLNFEHFDLYGTTMANLLLRGYTSVNAAALNTGSRTGTHALRCPTGAGAQSLTWNLPAAASVMGQGAAIFAEAAPSGTGSNNQGLYFGTAASSTAIRVVIGADLAIHVYQGTTLLGSSAANVFSAASWFWMEAKITSGTGSGRVQVRLNGDDTDLLDFTGLTIANITRVTLGHNGTTSTANVRYDDWVVWDTVGGDTVDWMGDTFVVVAAPEADTAVVDWDASTGTSRFAMIDEATPSDSEYIQSDTVADACEFTHPALNLGIGSIAAIASQTRAFKSDAGAASYKTGIKSGSSTAMSDEIALATGPNVHIKIAERNPDGNVPWTQSAANAARLRVERTA